MRLRHLWLTDFRSYHQIEVDFPAGLTAIVGANGEGKTNLLEGVAYLATLGSFRGAPVEALVRQGCPAATVRAQIDREGRELLIEAELAAKGRNRIQVNRQRLTRSRDLLGALRVSVFAPDDLALVKAGPAERRRYLDDTVVAAQPRYDAVRSEVSRILRQRNALLQQAGGRLSDEVALTLDVWTTKLVEAGEELTRARVALLDQLEPELVEAYGRLAGRPAEITAEYRSSWLGPDRIGEGTMDLGLARALEAVRADELRRRVSLVGPHRDDVELTLDGMPARTHASQGEQRTLALALRLAAHQVVTAAAGTAPLLLLDDVFSELDPDRSRALVESLGSAQTLLTTAGPLPPGAVPERVLRIADGTIHPG